MSRPGQPGLYEWGDYEVLHDDGQWEVWGHADHALQKTRTLAAAKAWAEHDAWEAEQLRFGTDPWVTGSLLMWDAFVEVAHQAADGERWPSLIIVKGHDDLHLGGIDFAAQVEGDPVSPDRFYLGRDWDVVRGARFYRSLNDAVVAGLLERSAVEVHGTELRFPGEIRKGKLRLKVRSFFDNEDYGFVDGTVKRMFYDMLREHAPPEPEERLEI
jgi:hypothetical protein